MNDPVSDLLGQPVHDRDGADLGQVEHVYVEDTRPVWVATGDKLVPLASAELEQDGVRVAVDRATVEAAPAVDDPEHLNEAEQQAVYQHYAAAPAFTTDPSDADLSDAVPDGQAGEGRTMSLLEDPRPGPGKKAEPIES